MTKFSIQLMSVKQHLKMTTTPIQTLNRPPILKVTYFYAWLFELNNKEVLTRSINSVFDSHYSLCIYYQIVIFLKAASNWKPEKEIPLWLVHPLGVKPLNQNNYN